jgi:UDP-2,3-diacylglucosamine pyrophosphatase LpxH
VPAPSSACLQAIPRPPSGAEQRAPDQSPNVLIISDLHLGEGLGAGWASTNAAESGDASEQAPASPNHRAIALRTAALSRELGEFLDHHREHRVDDRPWRLVIAGDMVDLMQIRLGGARPETSPRAVDRKMDLILGRYRAVFEKLAAFVGAGHDLVIVLGNHDAELHWEDVREAFLDRLARLAPPPAGGPGGGGVDLDKHRAAVRQRMQFVDWFYYQHDLRLYVEHGHQYDAYSSFAYHLYPVTPDGESTAPTFGHLGMHYFVSADRYIDWTDQENWGLSDYVRWAAQQGLRGVLDTIGRYVKFIGDVMGSRFNRSWDHAARHLGEKQKDRLQKVAERARVPEPVLEQLARLGHRPAWQSLPRILMTFYLDRMLLLAATALVVTLVWKQARWGWAVGLGFAALALVGGNFLLARLREVKPAADLRRVSTHIRELMDAQLVVMGHTHEPHAHPLGDGRWYINIGSWIPHVRPEGASREGGPGARSISFTHLKLCLREAGRGALAQLCTWKDGKSEPLVDAVPIAASGEA